MTPVDRVSIEQTPEGYVVVNIVSCMCNGRVTYSFVTNDVKITTPLVGYDFKTVIDAANDQYQSKSRGTPLNVH